MIAFETGLVTSTIGLAIFPILSQLDVLKAGNDLGHLSAVGLLGVVAVASVCGMVYVYKSKEKDQQVNRDKMEKLIADSVASHQKSADAIDKSAGLIEANTAVLVEVKTAIVSCGNKA